MKEYFPTTKDIAELNEVAEKLTAKAIKSEPLWCAVEKKRGKNVKLDFFLKAICEMKVVPSKSLFRREFQTTISCCG